MKLSMHPCVKVLYYRTHSDNHWIISTIHASLLYFKHMTHHYIIEETVLVLRAPFFQPFFCLFHLFI